MNPAPSDKPPEPMPTAPTQSAPTMPQAAAQPAPPPAADLGRPPRDPVKRFYLVASAALFFGWLAWLSYAALTKSREPIVSHAQAAIAPLAVRAKVEADSKGVPAMQVTVVESLGRDGPAKDAKISVANLPAATGFVGSGEYLLPLAMLPDGAYQLVGPRPSASDSDSAPIYPWSADVAAQVKRLYPDKK